MTYNLRLILVLFAVIFALPAFGNQDDKDDSLARHFSALITEEAVKNTIDDHRRTAEAYVELGQIYYRKGYYLESFNAFMTALRIAEDEQFESLLPDIYNGLGNVYCTWEDYPQGLKHFRKSMDYAQRTANRQSQRTSLINLFGVHYALNDIAGADSCYRELNNFPDQDSISRYFSLQNKGLLLWKKKQFAEATAQITRAAEYARQSHLDQSIRCAAFSYLAQIQQEAGNSHSALEFLYKSLGDNPASLPPYLQRDTYRQLAMLCRSLGMEKEAAAYGQRYLIITDSLFEEAKINRIKDTRLMYETDKAYNTINRLNAEKRKKERQLAFISTGILILAALSITLYRKERQLNQAYKSLFARNQELLSVAGSLHRETTHDCIPDNRAQNLPETAPDSPDSEKRLHSSDKLTESQRKEIEAAIRDVFDQGCPELLDCNFSIERLATLTGYNSRYVSTVLNDAYGQNFRSIVNLYRIREAQKRLLDTKNYGNYTIQAIALSVGYKSHANFILLFKKYVGMTPSLYLKIARKESHTAN